VEAGGYTVRVPAGYTLAVEDGTARLSAGDGSPAAGATVFLDGGPRSHFAAGAGETPEAILARLAELFAGQSALAAGAAGAIQVGGLEGLGAPLVSETTAGQFVLVQPSPDHIVILAAVAPVDVWEGQAAADFAAVLNTLSFFPPPSSSVQVATGAGDPDPTPMMPSPTPGPGAPPTGGTPEPTATLADVPEQSTVRVPEGAAATPEADAPTPTPAASPVAALQTSGLEPAVRVYSNGNFVNGVAVMRSTIWAATGGGVVAWNKSSGGYVKFTTADGLSTNRTVAAAVCPYPGLGVLFASDLGIQVFDTQNGSWKTLDTSNSEMSHNDVAALWCDPEDGLLAVGYARHGLDLFDAGTGDWTYLDEDDGLAVTGIRAIAARDAPATGATPIWLATDNGLAVYEDGEISLFTDENSPLEENRVETLAVDGSGAVWLATGNTLYRTDGTEWDAFNGDSAGQADFPNGLITGLDVGDDGAIWIGSDQAQLCRFDPGIEGCVAFYSGAEGMATAPLTSLTIGPDGHVYYTTAGGGISIFDGAAWRPLVIANEMVPGNNIHDLAQDPSGMIWVAATGGAASLAPDTDSGAQIFTPANSQLPSVDVRVAAPQAGAPSTAAPPSGPESRGVWFGAEGASYYDGATWTNYTSEDGLAGSTIQAITPDDQSRTWIGTQTGLSIWTGNTFFNLTTANGLPSEDITALQADGDVIWIGTRGGGLLRFQDNQLQVFNSDNINLPGNTITALALGGDGALYIGTDRGLARFADNIMTPILELDAGPAEPITALAAGDPNAGSGIVWVATAGNQVYAYDGQSWTRFDPVQLPGPQITTLLVDANGEIWIGCSQGGLARYTLQLGSRE
jgi:ligand-binding sensor domain-containing protein